MIGFVLAIKKKKKITSSVLLPFYQSPGAEGGDKSNLIVNILVLKNTCRSD